MDSYSKLDLGKYIQLAQAVGAMSGLYSESDIPLIHPRFVEKLFCFTTGARDLARDDTSFDAITHDLAGVGVKTFRAESIDRDCVEKVAEFAKIAAGGVFKSKSKEELAIEVSLLRNARVSSDAAEYSINLSASFYHCLVRLKGGAFIHEEPYRSIEISRITPTNSQGKEIAKFPSEDTGHVYFHDGHLSYMFNTSKNVLYKRFHISKPVNSDFFPIPVEPDILNKLISWPKGPANQAIREVKEQDKSIESVVLPLYSTSSSSKFVAPKSGINQWNAGGRVRKFGEAYVPIPAAVRKKFPDFFPSLEQNFRVKLPNNKVIQAKVCQENGKALMSDPNTDLCEWLFSVIDGRFDIAENRLTTRRPYVYSDLVKIGKDSVRLVKLDGIVADFALETAELDSYERQMTDEVECREV